MHSVFVHILLFITRHLLTVLNKKNAVDLQSVGVQSLNTHHNDRGKTTHPIKNTHLCQCMTFFSLVVIKCFTFNNSKVTMLHSSNHNEHYGGKKTILSHMHKTQLHFSATYF